MSVMCMKLPVHRRISRAIFHACVSTHLKIHSFSSNRLIDAAKSQSSITGKASVDSDIDLSRSLSDPSLNALKLFDELHDSDVVSVSALLSRLAKSHRHRDVLLLFSRMLLLDIRPNEFTFGTVIHSSTELEDLSLSRQLHACSTKMGLSSHVFVGSAVLDSYVKLGTVKDARRVFEDTNDPNVVSYTTLICGYLKRGMFEDAVGVFRAMPDKNTVSWNAVIAGCSQMGRNEDAVNFFVEMMREGWIPDKSSFPCAISAAANIAGLGMGRSFHACVIKCLGKPDVFVGNSLISFYAKCGSMEDSLLVFQKLMQRNIVSFNAVIYGLAQNGKAKEAIDFFEKMQYAGFKPNGVTCLGLLWACNHAGLVDEGYSYFIKWRSEESPDLLKPEHYACMVDLLSRCGRFVEAEQFISDLPFDPGIGFWKAVLGGCQIHSNLELGELAARKILALDPMDVSSYVMLSNAHSAAGRWERVSSMRKEMKERGLLRVPGCSWIEGKNKLHVFVTSDRNHEQKDEIYVVMGIFLEHLKEMEAPNLLLELDH
ncbi:pentatricopeptide repeat-containing protein At5g42450, mitochondrial [Punica granatum]|uniref:Pentatricopeptide repeat-containing protein At5g42450, mitochondrial n=1 Tax=Punica granatum TaxID=22663 RepID=A0A6P8DRZ3_PUNGR|nr:pentatricopeptide repeat-containing protein At5g42450, mitochondrial [Punica granatum]